MKLLYRGKKRKEEFLTDYIMRISYKNGYSSLNKFKTALILFYRENFGGLHNLRYQAMRRVTLEFLLKRNIPIDQYHKFYNVKRGDWRSQVKFCRSCWNDDEFIRFYWWLESYKRCHKHQEDLVTENCEFNKIDYFEESDRFDFITSLIIFKYEGDEFCQNLILNEIQRAKNDNKIIDGLEKYFGYIEEVSISINKLKRVWGEGGFVGACIEERIDKFSDILSEGYGYKEFWIRILYISVLSNKKGLFLGFSFSDVNDEYVRCSRYFLDSDHSIENIMMKIENLKEYSKMKDVCIEGGFLDGVVLSEELILIIKMSLFYFKSLWGGYFESIGSKNSVFDFVPKKRDCHANREL